MIRRQDESGWLLEGGLPSIHGPVNEIVNHPSASLGSGHEAVVSGSAASFKSLARSIETQAREYRYIVLINRVS